MSPTEFKAIRERLGLSQEELAKVLCLAGKKVISNIETGVRNPSGLAIIIMRILDEGSVTKRKELISLLSKYSVKFAKGLDA